MRRSAGTSEYMDGIYKLPPTKRIPAIITIAVRHHCHRIRGTISAVIRSSQALTSASFDALISPPPSLYSSSNAFTGPIPGKCLRAASIASTTAGIHPAVPHNKSKRGMSDDTRSTKMNMPHVNNQTILYRHTLRRKSTRANIRLQSFAVLSISFTSIIHTIHVHVIIFSAHDNIFQCAKKNNIRFPVSCQGYMPVCFANIARPTRSFLDSFSFLQHTDSANVIVSENESSVGYCYCYCCLKKERLNAEISIRKIILGSGTMVNSLYINIMLFVNAELSTTSNVIT